MQIARQISTADMQSPCIYISCTPPIENTIPIFSKSNSMSNHSTQQTSEHLLTDGTNSPVLVPVLNVNMTKRKESFSQRLYNNCVIGCGACVVIILINIIIAFTVVKIYHLNNHGMSLCLPCDSLVLEYNNEDDYREYFYQTGFEDGNPKCCAENTEQMELMLKVVSGGFTINQYQLRIYVNSHAMLITVSFKQFILPNRIVIV